LSGVGAYTSISDIARAERIERGYLGRLLRLTLLVPDIVEAILVLLCRKFEDLAALS
jgi:hypothetical protein